MLNKIRNKSRCTKIRVFKQYENSHDTKTKKLLFSMSLISRKILKMSHLKTFLITKRIV
jgi:hypothetical protein